MARIRSIKPEIRRSLVVSSWPYPVRWTFVGLPGYLDDSGRGHDNTALIKAELYPLDDDMTARKLEQHLITIATNGPLCRYEVAGQRYLHVTSWDEHQRINRPSPSRIPPCPIHEPSVSHSLNGSVSRSVNVPGALTEGSLPRAQARVPAEQGVGAGSKEGSSEQGTREPRDTHRGGTQAQALLDGHLALRQMPAPAAQRLHQAIVESLKEASADDVRAALAEWRRRPAAKPGLLPHLVADVVSAKVAQQLADDPTQTPEAQAWLAAEQAKRAGAAR